ncbi:MAG TPA: S46 family peptidase, partial [Thermoanaerobaculia bacterium]|nr:S46 family peptidase [Thermoanaerobaculia bacterium]
EIRAKEDAELRAWIDRDPILRKTYGKVLDELAAVNAALRVTRERDSALVWLFRGSPMLSQASTLVRLSMEREKPDLEREAGYQERDWSRIGAGIERAQRSLHPKSDRIAFAHFLREASALPGGQRIAALDALLKAAGGATAEEQIERLLEGLYAETKVGDLDARLAMFGEDRATLEGRKDPFLQLAKALMPLDLEIEKRDKQVEGALMRIRPRFMQALLAMKGGKVYPDANGTLRLTFGTVTGYSPRDAVQYAPQTTLSGILQKDTGKEPFDSPKTLLAAAAQEKPKRYIDPDLGDVPVNFLSTVDSTGGNSGSATLNAKGELIGLLFDGNYESMASDYLVDPVVTRSIHVDVLYMLWAMDQADGADHLLREMGVAPATE